MRVREERACLDESNPVLIEYAFPHKLLDFLVERYIHPRSLRCDIGHQPAPLFRIHRILKEHLGRLGEYDSNQKLDHLPTQIRTRRMQKVLIDITQHPSTRPEVVKRALQPLGVTPALRGGDGRVGDGNLEEDRRFFVGHRCLGCEF
jgi:hypothetical protein